MKAVQKKHQKNSEKERKKKKKKEDEAIAKASSKLKQTDFLLNPLESPAVEEDYEFSEYSSESDDPDIFEDSKETQSDVEFLTPINFTSVFGRRQAALSTSTPNPQRPNKRGAPSPKGSAIHKKKKGKRSLLKKHPSN